MDSTPTQVYEDFVPSTKMVSKEHFDTIQLTLPGFKKEQLRVQLTITGTLKISGQRPVGTTPIKWQRFQMEFPVAVNCDKSKISTKFENGILHVKQPIPLDDEDEFSKQDNSDIKEERKNNRPKTGEQIEAKRLAEKELRADKSSSSSSSYSESTDDEETWNMNPNGVEVSTPPTQVYEDFVPSSDLVQEQHSDTLHLNLPGFKREQLRVQLTKTGILKISGQRPIGQNKWQRFHKEFRVAENCDKTKISAKFENGVLYVKQLKLITSSVKKENELSAALAENTPAAKRQTTTLHDEFSKQDNADIDTPVKEEAKETSPKTSEQTEAKSLAENLLPATGNASCLAENLKKPRKVMKMTLVALSILGIGLYVANVMKSTNEAEE